jgi:excisionase family DNA binding protein
METKMLNVVEAAKLFGVSSKTMYGWAERRKVPHYKINGSVRFDPVELMEFKERCRVLTDHEKQLMA